MFVLYCFILLQDEGNTIAGCHVEIQTENEEVKEPTKDEVDEDDDDNLFEVILFADNFFQ